MLFMIDNIHNERGTYYTDSTLPGYYIMSVVCILYRYQDSALNHMPEVAIYPFLKFHFGIKIHPVPHVMIIYS